MSVTVNAFAAANANACVDGAGRANAAATQLSEAIGFAFVDVTALALAIVSPGAAETQIEVSAAGDNFVVSTVDGLSAAEVIGRGKQNTDPFKTHDMSASVARANSGTSGSAGGGR